MEPAPRLRFDRAAYGDNPTSLLHCGFCGRGIDALQFEILGRPACDICTRQAQSKLPADNLRVLTRAVGFGLVAALGSGLLLAAALEFIPHMLAAGGEFLAAWGVGWGIAKAIRTGARGARGRKYQVAGCLLAYAAMTYSVLGVVLGVQQDPWWTYPFRLLQPIGFLFTDLRPIGSAVIFAASIAMTWTWRSLQGPTNAIRKVN